MLNIVIEFDKTNMKVLIALEGKPNQGPNIWSNILFKELFKQYCTHGKNQVYQVETFKLKSLIYSIFHIREFDVFHFYSESPGAAMLYLLFKILGKKTIYTVHGNIFIEAKYKHWPINLLWVPAHLFVIKNVDAVTFPAKYLQIQIKQYLDSKKITGISNHYVIPNGININDYPIELTRVKSKKLREILNGKSALHILSITSFVFEPKTQGVDLLIKVNKILNKKGIKTELKIGGIGPQLKAYKENYESKNVKFLGYCDNFVENQWADIFVHLSFLDNFPMVILNAGAMGLATIASEIGGIPEIFNFSLNKKVWGLTINDEDIIADKILELIQDENFYLQVSREQYENIKEHFTIQTVSNQFWCLYLSL